MTISIRRNQRGFAIGEFRDRYGNPCSIQESSLADEACIWLGINSLMHLTQRHVADLLPLLQHFVATGSLPAPWPALRYEIEVNLARKGAEPVWQKMLDEHGEVCTWDTEEEAQRVLDEEGRGENARVVESAG
jgi:hypothetical protein